MNCRNLEVFVTLSTILMFRSASLDLNKLKDRPAVPSLPPRASPFNKQGEHGTKILSIFISWYQVTPLHQLILMTVETTRRSAPVFTDIKRALPCSAEQCRSYHRWDIKIFINNNNDGNVVQEVNDTVEERVVLEYQLDQLKTIGSSDQLSD